MIDLFSAPPYQPTTRQLAGEGMRQAVEHADAVELKWSERAYAFLERYAAANREFLTEDVRTWAHRNGLPLAPDNRAWGAVINRASRERLIVRDRYETIRIPPSHARPMPVWRSKTFGGVIL
jgi:hypothetical protein